MSSKNKIVVDRLAENIKKYAWSSLRSMLEEYIIKCRRDMLFQEKEFEEEVCIRFPDTWKDLQILPVDYRIGKNLSFAFNVSGKYDQLQKKDEYVYKYTAGGYIPDELRAQMAQQKVMVLYEEPAGKNEDEQCIEVALSRPFRHKDLKFLYAPPCLGEMLGSGSFRMLPLNVTFKLEARSGVIRFDRMYFSDPEGKREDYIRDSYNRPICLTLLEQVFRTKEKVPPEVLELRSRLGVPVYSSHGESLPPYNAQDETPGPEVLVVDSGDIEIPGNISVSDADKGCGNMEDLMKADVGDIEITHGMLGSRLTDALKDGHFCLADMDGDMSGAGVEVNSGKKVKTPEERAWDILADFAAFHYEKKRSGYFVEFDLIHPELNTAHFNLLLKADEVDRALEFVDVLTKNLIPDVKWRKYSEHELENKQTLLDVVEEFRKNDLIIIFDCIEKPVLRTDDVGTGAAYEEVKKKISEYEMRWGVISECARRENAAALIVIASDTVYRTTLRYNADIHDVVCDAHLRLKNLTLDDVYRLFMKELGKSSFGKMLDEDFESQVKEYIHTVYPKSELRGRYFIQAHLGKIYSKYILRGEDCRNSLKGCVPAYKMPSVDRILAQLKEKTGLGDVAKRFDTIYAMRDVLQMTGEPYHMAFVGNPGTGKTMVARMMAEMLFHMGVTKRPKLVEMRAGDFKSIWRGGTNSQVKGKIREAYGGVLFIDEAYVLADEAFNEGLAILLTEMSDKDNPERPVVILAGYEEKMRALLKANEGLGSRIKYNLKFRDYTRDELKSILKEKLKELEFTTEDTDEADGLQEDLILEKMSHEFFGNARDMEKLCFELIGAWGEMKTESGADQKYDQMVIRTEHMRRLLPKTDTRNIERILDDQPALKEELEKFKSGVAYKRALLKSSDNVKIPAVNLHMIFMGNPGTGKSTVARLLADYLCEAHILPTNKCIFVEAKDLISYTKNMTPAQHTEDYINRARGGILFVDEAYSLAKEPSGAEVVQVILTAMEKYKENTIFIFAGYSGEMDGFLRMNPGLQSRIGYTFRFESYSEEVLAGMFVNKLADIGLSFKDKEDAEKEMRNTMRYFRNMEGFGNGRFVESLLNATMNKHSARLAEKYTGALENCPPDEITTYLKEDIPTKKEILKTFFGIDRDPEEYERLEKETTVVHELGHATVAMAADIRHDPGVEKITIRSVYGAFGYVKYDHSKLRTEQDYKVWVASALGGRNAEKLYFGSHTHGCKSDFENAKWFAEQMVENFAMGDLGITTSMDILREADTWSTKLLHENKEFIDKMKPFLLKYEEMDGKDLRRAYCSYRDRIYRENTYKNPEDVPEGCTDEDLDAILSELSRKYEKKM